MKISNAKTRTPPPSLERKGSTIDLGSTVNVFNDDRKGEYYLLKIDQLIPFKHQARLYFDDEKIQELATTIKDHGLRQPLTVIKSARDPGKYEIVSGERRFRAAQFLNLKKIPCIILENFESADEVALIENIQREDLHPIELGKAYLQLYSSGFCKTQQEIADKIGVSRTQVTEYLSFATISNEDATALIKNQITERKHLRKIASIEDQTEREKLINLLISGNAINKDVKTEAKELAKAVGRKSNLVSISLSSGLIECKKRTFKQLSDEEIEVLLQHVRTLLNELTALKK